MTVEFDETFLKVMKFISHNRFRSLILLTGKNIKEEFQKIHYLWIKSSTQKRNPVLWCFKNNKKKSQSFNSRIVSESLKKVIKNIDINYCYYDETRKILGNTYGMCVLEDFENISPNILARIIETIEGGGMILFLVETINSMENIRRLSINVYKSWNSHAFTAITSRFIKNFIFSISNCPTFLHLNKENDFSKNLKVIFHGNLDKINSDSRNEKKKKLLQELLKNTNNMEPLTSLLSKTKTFDQARALLTFIEVISTKNLISTVILTSSRGRGKSAVIGLATAAAISYGLSNVIVTSANPENLNCFFGFLFIGFKLLNYSEGRDFEIVQNSKFKYIEKVIISVTHHQIIKFIPLNQINEKKDQIELLVVDEAALISPGELNAIIGPYIIFMSSTTSGYEGTGKEFNLRFIEDLKKKFFTENENLKYQKKRVLKEIFLEEPIRYSIGDPVEKWLNSFLCLDSYNTPILVSGCPDPRICRLFLVDRNSLFSGHKIANIFLQKIMAIFSSSHYRNSPDDIQILADAPSHRILVLISPQTFFVNFLPDILSILHISYEGQISRVFMEKNLMKERFVSGDLLPWVISKHFLDSSFGELSGIRIIRISTHPDIQNMGYGTRALEILKKFCTSKKRNNLKKKKNYQKNEKLLSALLIDINEQIQPLIDYLGVSFTLSSKLLCFWLKNGFSLIILKPRKESFKEQNVGIMVKFFSNSTKEKSYWLNFFKREFLKEFLINCSTEFRHISTNLIFNIIESNFFYGKKKILKNYISNLDFKKLNLFSSQSFISYKLIKHLIPIITKSCFWRFLEEKNLNLSEFFLLISMGFQLKNLNQLKNEFGIKKYNLIQILKNIINKFIKFL